MSNILGTVLSTLGNNYLHNQGVPITFNSNGQASAGNTAPAGIGGLSPITGLTAYGGTATGTTAPAAGSAAIYSTPVAGEVKSLGRWALAFVLFLGALLFLKPSEAAILSVTIVLGALLINAKSAAASGRKTVLQNFGG